jgi:hypothetical protein
MVPRPSAKSLRGGMSNENFRGYGQQTIRGASLPGVVATSRLFPVAPAAILDDFRYAMGLTMATTISGIDSLAVLRHNLAIARGFKPMTAEEMVALHKHCATAAGDGHLELYKSTMKYDGDVGQEQHGLPLHKDLPR